MNFHFTLRNSLVLWLITIPCCLIAQEHKFIGGILFNLNGIEFQGNTDKFWNTSSETIEISGTLGISAGLFVKREFSKNLYSTLEMRYSNKGSIYEFISQFGTRSFETIYLNYIELPVLAGYKVRLNKKIFSFEGGLAFGKMISSTLHANHLTSRLGTPHAGEFQTIDISWIGSLKFPIIRKWKDHVLFGLRVSRSIRPIQRVYKLYNFNYGVELNYLFN